MARRDGRPSASREFLTGASYILRGFGGWRLAPGAMFLGWLPAILVFAALVTGIAVLGVNLESIVTALTGFAEAWAEPWRTLTRVVAGVAVLLAGLFLGIYLFTTVTLIVGAWFYERIWAAVERRFGPVPDAGRGFWRSLGGDIGDFLRMLVPTLLLGVLLLALGLIPIVGPIAAIVLGAFVGGWLLTIDLTSFAMRARGLSLRERRRVIRDRRALTLGFGVATYLVFLIPGGTILAMPAAVAGATLLSRRVLGEPSSIVPSPPA